MNFNSSEARRILRLEANVRDINEKLSQLQSTNPGSTQNQMDVNSDPPIAIQASGYVPQFTVPQQAKKRKIVFNNIGMGKRVTLHPVSPVTQAVERAKRLLVYKRKLGNRKVNKRRKVKKRRSHGKH